MVNSWGWPWLHAMKVSSCRYKCGVERPWCRTWWLRPHFLLALSTLIWRQWLTRHSSESRYIFLVATLSYHHGCSVSCLRTMLETCALGELRSRFSDLREVGFRVIPVHPAVTWNAPILTLNKEKMVLIYEDVVLQLDAVVFLRLHLPPFYGEGAIYCPRRLRKKDLVAQLGLQIPCDRTGSECRCYVNSVELTNGADAEVEDGDVIWCLRASPDMGHEIEILSVGSPSDASEAEGAAPFYAWICGSARMA